MNKKGKVYIMGVGPGDYKLITMKALDAIKKADVIVYDRLVNPKLLQYKKDDAKLIYVGKKPDFHAVKQEGINNILVKEALEGNIVARVKGGDPFVFGRGGEEALELVKNNIKFEIIPGITSGISVPAYAGIPVTHRDCSSSLHIITGHEDPTKESSFLDYEVLAKLKGTLVFYMGVKNLPNIAKSLIDYGKEKETLIAIIERGTTHEQRVVTGKLDNIEEVIKENNIKSPAITVIGEVVDYEKDLQWFKKGSLSNKKIIVTRAREQESKLVQMIEDEGGEAIEFPTIKIEKPDCHIEFDNALEQINTYKYLVLTSVNGVNYFFERMTEKRIDIRSLQGIKVCAVGEVTAKEIEKKGILVDYIPKEYTTNALLKGLLKIVNKNEKILLARSDLANKELYNGLKDEGYEVDDIITYKTALQSLDKDEIVNKMKESKIDAITFTSSSTVDNFMNILGLENKEILNNTKIICIGPVTRDTAIKYNLNNIDIAKTYTIEGLMDKLKADLK